MIKQYQKLSILFLALLSLTSCRGQQEFNGSSIFLGEYTDSLSLKVLKNDTILYISKDSLEQSNQYTPQKFIQQLDSLGMSFVLEGDEPSWKLVLSKYKLSFTDYSTDELKSYEAEIYYDDQSGFRVMFKSLDNSVFGVIQRVDYTLNGEDACGFSMTDNHLVMEAIVTVNRKVLKGCVRME